MPEDAPEIVVELPGWRLFVALLERDSPTASVADMDALFEEAERRLRERFAGTAALSSDPVVQAVRRGFRRTGTDPTKHRPSFEALARRVLKGKTLPRIDPVVDACNVLSLRLHVPVCLVDMDQVSPPFRLVAGREAETFLSLKGPYHAEGKPTLRDARGIVGTPIVDSERTKVTGQTRRALLYAYLPTELPPPEDPETALRDILSRTGAARVSRTWYVDSAQQDGGKQGRSP